MSYFRIPMSNCKPRPPLRILWNCLTFVPVLKSADDSAILILLFALSDTDIYFSEVNWFTELCKNNFVTSLLYTLSSSLLLSSIFLFPVVYPSSFTWRRQYFLSKALAYFCNFVIVCLLLMSTVSRFFSVVSSSPAIIRFFFELKAKLEWADYAAVRAKCGNLSRNELTSNLSEKLVN